MNNITINFLSKNTDLLYFNYLYNKRLLKKIFKFLYSYIFIKNDKIL